MQISLAGHTPNLEYAYLFPLAIVICTICTSSGFSGSILFQPIFNLVVAIPLPQSIATGIATETIGMWNGTLTYLSLRKGLVAGKIIMRSLPAVLLGVACGISIFFLVPRQFIRLLVGSVMLVIAGQQLHSLRKKPNQEARNEVKGQMLTRLRWRLYQFLSGLFSASTGTGVAEMNQPLLMNRLGLAPPRANATAIALEAIADLAITAINLKAGNIRYDILIFTASGVLVGGQIGPRIAHRLHPSLTRIVFSIAISSIGIYYIATSIGPPIWTWCCSN